MKRRLASSVIGCLLWVALQVPANVFGQIDATLAVVRIEATQPIAEESSAPFRRLAFVGELTISRTGPTNHALPFFLEYSGSATPGVDYPVLPWALSIPAGARSTVVRVEAKPDDVPEPIETLVATLSMCPPGDILGPCFHFEIEPAHTAATIYLREDGITEASLAITRPHSGEVFREGAPIEIDAVAIDLNGYIPSIGFFDGDRQIGESTLFFFVAPDPGTPIYHNFTWRGAAAGPHVLTVRTRRADGTGLTSLPVRITVHTNLPPPASVVRIEATQPIAEEDSFPLERLPLVGLFTISRTGPTDHSQPVFLHVSGTATPDVDYQAIPFLVSIPAGAVSTTVRVDAVPDRLEEGRETVIAKLSNCPPETDPRLGIPCYLFDIDPAHAEAAVTIRDTAADPNHPPAVGIVRPADGATFPLDTAIAIVAAARDPDGYVHRAEFFANDRKIGEETIEFLVPPPPGETQSFEFLWRLPAPGSHRLTVRVTDNLGATGTSTPVDITVGSDPTLPVVTVMARDALATEPGLNTTLDTASFAIQRHGPTNAPLTVYFSLEGTAENGVDYGRVAGLVVIPAGRRLAPVTIRPLTDDRAERDETVALRLQLPPDAAGGYLIGRSSSALAIIRDASSPRFAPGTHCLRLDDHCALVVFEAEDGFPFRVEASPDLQNWETLGVQTAVESQIVFVDEDASAHHRRFYRINPEPAALEE